MAKDGRLTVRFGSLREAIDEAAAADDRKPSDWVKRQIRRVLRQRRRAAERVAAGPK